MEIKVKEAKIAKTSFNYEEVKIWLNEQLGKYRNKVYTPNCIKDAKADRAGLNTLKTAIDNKRKELKKMYLAPYQELEDKFKELTGLIGTVIDENIDPGIQKAETDRKNKKYAEIEQFFNDNVGDLSELLRFKTIFSEKWLNVGSKMPSIEKVILDKIENTNAGLATIKALDSKFEAQLNDLFLRTFDLGACTNENKRLMQHEEKMQEFEQKQAEKKEKEVEPVVAPTQTEKPLERPTEPQQKTEIPEETILIIKATRAQKIELKKFLIQNNIEYSYKEG